MPKKIDVKGTIISNDQKWIYDWFEMDSTCPNDVSKILNESEGEEVEVQINSGGGSVYAGSEIYTALKSYPGKVNVKIVGVAASAAGVIAMAGDFTEISPTAQIMIHNVSSIVAGDYRDLQHEAKVIENYNKSIANAYVLKTGIEQKELLDLMDQETWLNAQQAKEMGFVDSVMFNESMQLVASASNSIILPNEVINKIRNSINNIKKNEKVEKVDFELYQSKLNLIKLKEIK